MISSAGEEAGPAGAEAVPKSLPVTLNRERARMLGGLEKGSSPGFLAELAAVYVGTSSELVRRLRRSFEAGDSQDGALAAHELKSGSLNMGGERLAALCDALEKLCRRESLASASGLVAEVEAELERVHAALDRECRNLRKEGEMEH